MMRITLYPIFVDRLTDTGFQKFWPLSLQWEPNFGGSLRVQGSLWQNF